DAIIFAVIAATFIRLFFIEAYTIPTSSMEKSMMVGDYLFVSKTAYGPKMPNTPISFPFVHHTMPLSTTMKSFSTIIHYPYRRIAGFGKVKNDDVVVFNFPEGDTVAVNMQERSYYELVRSYGRDKIWGDKRVFGDIIYRPVDKRENYIKRCVAIAGDSLKIDKGQVYVNGKPQKEIPGIQYKYLVNTNGTAINAATLEKLDITQSEVEGSDSRYIMSLTTAQAQQMDGLKFIQSKEKVTWPADNSDPAIFPSDPKYTWNLDNFGPIWIPKKGVTINLSVENLPLYKRIIDVYEENDLQVKDGTIYINGTPASTYTFKMDYYWMMGDNRYNSADSRYWGFVPEDHIVGKASFVWLSLDKNKSFLSKIRWNRFFMGIK
ncbi:MAG TPA: signal peptidase I, partial [Prolixibacteraceae bacterium]|nr:signal peptidase I [Prolixibacteraceae bacterium]